MSPKEKRSMGQIKFYSHTKKYGFIKVFRPTGMEDVFFHISDYKADEIYKDWWVEFTIEASEKGKQAVNLRRVSQPPESKLFGTDFVY
ncbi:cold shock domain-containing protein [Haladaptatus sp. ZSTT2]|uniref:cold shock domain-containing protein n=1 Tax=Haladaptatus sp. ZSTT2 TaxID=3120515 RepID=UPI00300EDD8C